MKTKIFSYLSLLGILCLLTACPYESTVPIGKPDTKIDKKFLGKWIETKALESENPEYFEIQKHDKTLYKIVKNTYNSSDSTYRQETYISHITKIGDVDFLNMQKDGVGKYFLHRIDLADKEFSLYEITDNIDEKFNTSEELKAFVSKNMHLSFFYNKDEQKYSKQ